MIEKILKEINRLKKELDGYSASEALDYIEAYINTLPKEPSCEKKDYYERYEKLVKSDSFKSSYCGKSLGKEESSCEIDFSTKNEDLEEEIKNWIKTKHFVFTEIDEVIETAKHFAEWQKQKDQETIELAEDHAMLAGMNKMKEEMMKNAVEAALKYTLENLI